MKKLRNRWDNAWMESTVNNIYTHQWKNKVNFKLKNWHCVRVLDFVLINNTCTINLKKQVGGMIFVTFIFYLPQSKVIIQFYRDRNDHLKQVEPVWRSSVVWSVSSTVHDGEQFVACSVTSWYSLTLMVPTLWISLLFLLASLHWCCPVHSLSIHSLSIQVLDILVATMKKL